MCSHLHVPMSLGNALSARSWPGRLWAWRLIPLLLPIWIYKRLLSPVLPRSCRFEPTCSEYMFQALSSRGVFLGLIIGTWRVLRCNPWGGSGEDQVEAFRWPWQPRREGPSTPS